MENKVCILCGTEILAEPLYVDLSPGFRAPIHQTCTPKGDLLHRYFGLEPVPTIQNYTQVLAKAHRVNDDDVLRLGKIKKLDSIRLSRPARRNLQAWLLEQDRTKDVSRLEGAVESLFEYTSLGKLDYFSPVLFAPPIPSARFHFILVPQDAYEYLNQADWLPKEARLQRLLDVLAYQVQPTSLGKELLRAYERGDTLQRSSTHLSVNIYRIPREIDRNYALLQALSELSNVSEREKQKILEDALEQVDRYPGHTTMSVDRDTFVQVEALAAETETPLVKLTTALILYGYAIQEELDYDEVYLRIKELNKSHDWRKVPTFSEEEED